MNPGTVCSGSLAWRILCPAEDSIACRPAVQAEIISKNCNKKTVEEVRRNSAMASLCMMV